MIFFHANAPDCEIEKRMLKDWKKNEKKAWGKNEKRRENQHTLIPVIKA